jgi:hypothetical protein
LLADGVPRSVLDGALLRELFDIEAELRGDDVSAWVDFAP